MAPPTTLFYYRKRKPSGELQQQSRPLRKVDEEQLALAPGDEPAAAEQRRRSPSCSRQEDIAPIEAMGSVAVTEAAAVPDPVFGKLLRRSARCINRPRAATYAEQEDPKQSTGRRGRPKKKRDADAQVAVKVVAMKKTVRAEPKKWKDVEPISVNDSDAKLPVKETRRMFNNHFLRSVQEERERAEAVKERIKAGSKEKKPSQRGDWKAYGKMKENNSLLYTDKIIGPIPGIDVGDQFDSRAEMCVLGIHHQLLKGIDYMGMRYKKKKGNENLTFPLTTSVVLSGMYEDDFDNGHEIIYTGEGGNDYLGDHRQKGSQEWKRGNKALGNSMDNGNPIRVFRGHKIKKSDNHKVYTYDGLYKVVKHWAQYGEGTKGCRVFKYKLNRLEGQPSLTTSKVRFTRGEAPRSTSELPGLILDDISEGKENFPIPVTNLVDNPPVPPPGFAYIKSLKISEGIEIPSDCTGCDCKGDCASNKDCSCARLNGSNQLPYVSVENVGRLVEAKAVVFECGPSCSCNRNCVNRTSQQGLQYRLEVFKTATKGWGVRSWDTILAGAPICEYVGVLKRTEDVDGLLHNNYLFDIDCLQTMKGLEGRQKRAGSDMHLPSLGAKNDSESPEYCIDGGSIGNVARFFNHSCDPNVFVQCILSNHKDTKLAKLMFFAAATILPLQELCYDYGYAMDSVISSGGDIVKLPCFCSAPNCRKRLY